VSNPDEPRTEPAQGNPEGEVAASSPFHPFTPSPLHPFSPDTQPLRILGEDHHLLVVNKPAPLLTQAPPAVPSLEAMAKAYIKTKHNKPAGVYLGIPHRLDRPVSGVVCFVRNTKAAQRIHAQFQEHRVRKVYWALVAGEVAPDADTWEDWVRKLPAEARVERAAEGEPGAKLAMLGYRVLQRLEGATLLELTPLTGRMHQLRVQAAWRGHPVLGDASYGSTHRFGPGAELSRDRVIALHARSLTLTHPFTKEELTWVADVPNYWPAFAADAPPGRSES
jgi:23S rRNA pseudouridine1911/1915/1917 synthase